MCGIVGMAGDLAYQDKEIFKDLLTVCQLRGTDSTGAIRVKQDNSVGWCKAVGLPDVLMNLKHWENQIENGLGKAYIGHCRAKTVGKNHVNNAHPFDFDNVVGVHNGTLRGWSTDADAKNHEVDSSWLYNQIAEKGVKEAVENLDNDGAWALVWWDRERNSLNFLRNSRRPLWFAWDKDKKKLFWASEVWMLYVVERKLDLYRDPETKQIVFTPLPENQHWEFEIVTDFHLKKSKPVFTLKPVQEIKGVDKPVAANFQHNRGWNGYYSTRSEHFTKDSPKGGEVASPFRGQLDDDLGDLMRAESPTTHTLGKPPVSPSPALTGSSTEQKSSKNSNRPILSLPSPTTKNFQSNSNEKPSDGCVLLFERKGSNKKSPLKKVSFRTVAGIPYITNNLNSNEQEEHVFLEKTNGICSWCNTPIGDLEEVHTILPTNDKFICTTCMEY